MATATQIKSLLQSHGNRDDERFYSTALQVAAAEARQGHEKLAMEIRGLVEKARRNAAGAKTNPTIKDESIDSLLTKSIDLYRSNSDKALALELI